MIKWFEPWPRAWRNGSYRSQFFTTIPVLLAMLLALRVFLEFIEQRPGVVLHDPLVNLFTPVDLSWITFSIIYAGLILGLIVLSFNPWEFLRTLQAYIIMVAIRIVCMYFLPLDPPVGLIPLHDPFVEYFGSGTVLTRDLFFSGHTATLLLIALGIPWRDLKIVFFVAAGAVALFVLWQHVHYTIDVVAAPFFAIASYYLAGLQAVKEPPLSSARNPIAQKR